MNKNSILWRLCRYKTHLLYHPNTYDDIFSTIRHIIATKITREHLINYLKHSYKIYKS